MPVPRYLKSWEDRNPIILEMDYCRLDLAQFIELRRRQNLPFTEEEVVLVLSDVVKALQALHSLGYAHMDIKPGRRKVIRKYPGIRDGCSKSET